MEYNLKFSNILRSKLKLAEYFQQYNNKSIFKQIAPLWYKDYLILMHSIIRSSVPLMKYAEIECEKISNKDKLAIDVGEYFRKHIKEETNHDNWLLEDLEQMNVSRNEILTKKPSEEVAELVGSQYYWIHHWHPISLLGYIAFLEGHPPEKNFIDKLKENTGFPDGAFRTIIKHSELDTIHRDDLNILLDSLPLTPLQEKWITSNALYSAKKFSEINYKAFEHLLIDNKIIRN